ncbi:hypothetical protein FTX61_15105 [Nitriliruptoraceae bacterium ZYF776]|nr:hypothetical protein [Profundirhabdus halotolerans]
MPPPSHDGQAATIGGDPEPTPTRPGRTGVGPGRYRGTGVPPSRDRRAVAPATPPRTEPGARPSPRPPPRRPALAGGSPVRPTTV